MNKVKKQTQGFALQSALQADWSQNSVTEEVFKETANAGCDDKILACETIALFKKEGCHYPIPSCAQAKVRLLLFI